MLLQTLKKKKKEKRKVGGFFGGGGGKGQNMSEHSAVLFSICYFDEEGVIGTQEFVIPSFFFQQSKNSGRLRHYLIAE